MNKELIEKMNQHIQEQGVKKTFLARKFGISPSHFGNWLHGRFNVSREVEEQIRKYLEERE